MTTFIVFALLADLLWWRWADLRLRRFSRACLWRALLAGFICAQTGYALCYLIDSNWTRSARNMVPLPMHVSAYLWHLLILPLAWMVILAGKAARLARLAQRKSVAQGPGRHRLATVEQETVASSVNRPRPGPVAYQRQNGRPTALIDRSADPTLSRRRLMAHAAAVAVPPLAAFGMSAATFVQLGQFRVRHVEIKIPGLPPDLHGLTIAQVTDIHLGKLTRPGMPRRIADAANEMNADLVLFSGDLIDYSLADLPAGIDFIRRLKPRHGPEYLAMIEGNHDLLEDAAFFEQTVRSAGLPILIDEARTIRVPGRQTPVQLLALCWGVPGSVDRMHMDDADILASMGRVMPLRDPGAFPILLTHHPHAFDPAADAGLPLTLAGHTHGGQIMLTDHIGAGPLRFRYWTGLYRKGASQLFVNNGVGNWFPLRYNAPAEIVKITLMTAPATESPPWSPQNRTGSAPRGGRLG